MRTVTSADSGRHRTSADGAPPVRRRVELRWVLAVYAVAYASVVVTGAVPDLLRLPVLQLLLWPALFGTFWVIARRAFFPMLASAVVALLATAAAWLFDQLEPLLESRSMEAALYHKPLPLVVFGLGILVVLVVLSARRDGAWKGLAWLALAEFCVTIFAYYAITVRASEPGVWAHLQSTAFVATGSWEPAVRVTLAWLLAMVAALQVRDRRRHGPREAAAPNMRNGGASR